MIFFVTFEVWALMTTHMTHVHMTHVITIKYYLDHLYLSSSNFFNHLFSRLGSRIEDCNSWRADLQTELDNNIRSISSIFLISFIYVSEFLFIWRKRMNCQYSLSGHLQKPFCEVSKFLQKKYFNGFGGNPSKYCLWLWKYQSPTSNTDWIILGFPAIRK